MRKYQTLLAQIKNVPQAVTNRITKLEAVIAELEVATETNKTEPSDENQDVVDQLNERVIAMENSIVERLEAIIEAESKTPAPEPAPTPKPEPTPEPTPNPEPNKKKSGFGFVVAAIIVSAITLGAVALNKRQ
jgi:hypothetical protein